MRIISYSEFLKLPSNTVYATNFNGNFSEFRIKKDIFPDGDWTYAELSPMQFVEGGFVDGPDDYFETLKDAQQNGIELEMDFNNDYINSSASSVDPYAPEDYTYAVFNKDDIIAMIKMLFTAVASK